jgi:hypothetical protein
LNGRACCGDSTIGCWSICTLGITNLAARVTAITAQRELAANKVVHAEVEELNCECSPRVSEWDHGIDTEIHIAIGGAIIMAHSKSVQ